MLLRFCGVRGSSPSPGPTTVRYGGNTSCVAISHGDESPSLVLDAGTGLRNLTRALSGAPFQGTILIGHLHWDHTQGLPFFGSGLQPEARVRVLFPEQGDPTEVMDRAFAPPYFPSRIEDLEGSWTVGSLDEGEHEFEGFTVTAREIPHKLSRTFGFRVSDGTSTIAYLSDHWPTSLGPGADGHGEYHESALLLAKDADLLIHDSQYTNAEFERKAAFGHCTYEYAMGLAEAAGVRALSLYHHDPDRSDDELDAILAELPERSFNVSAAKEDTVLKL